MFRQSCNDPSPCRPDSIEAPARECNQDKREETRMTRRGLLGAAACAALLVAGMATVQTAAADDILLGGVGPLSQPGDVVGGQEMKWAMEQAVADLNAKGGVLGRQIKLVFYDTQ